MKNPRDWEKKYWKRKNVHNLLDFSCQSPFIFLTVLSCILLELFYSTHTHNVRTSLILSLAFSSSHSRHFYLGNEIYRLKREQERRGDRRFRSNRREFKIHKKGNPEKSHFQKQMQTHSLRFPRLFLRYPAQRALPPVIHALDLLSVSRDQPNSFSSSIFINQALKAVQLRNW